MTSMDNQPGPANELRKRAEETAREKPIQALDDINTLPPEEIRRMLHELHVHQIELEMQNDELRRTQAELETARARYFDLYDLAPVAYCTLSEKGLILEANLSTAGLLGMARGALVRQPIARFILKEDQDIYYLHRKEFFETSDPQACELRMVKEDGMVFWAHLAATAAQDQDGLPVCRIVLSDFTEHKQAEEALARSEEKFKAIANYTVDWESWFGPDGKYLWVNPAVEQITGYSAEEILAMPDFVPILIAEEDRSVFLAKFHDAICGSHGENYEFRYLQKNGVKRWLSVSWQPIFDAQGKPLGTRSSGRDITERKQMEESLRESEERWRSYVENAPYGIFIANEKGNYIQVNPTACSITGYRSDELLTKSIPDLLLPESQPAGRDHFPEGHRRKSLLW